LVQRILMMAALLMTPVLGVGQAVYEAQRAPLTLTAGGSFSYFDADYAGNKVTGIGAYTDFSPIVFDHLGLEAEGRWLMFSGSQSFREYNYLVGPRFRFSLAEHRGLHPYVKAMIGQGDIDFPYHLAYGRYLMFALGGGVDFAINHRMRVRADYENQILPDAPGIPGLPSGALKPNGVTAGVSYRIF
jgi:hypothetical protein